MSLPFKAREYQQLPPTNVRPVPRPSQLHQTGMAPPPRSVSIAGTIYEQATLERPHGERSPLISPRVSVLKNYGC